MSEGFSQRWRRSIAVGVLCLVTVGAQAVFLVTPAAAAVNTVTSLSTLATGIASATLSGNVTTTSSDTVKAYFCWTTTSFSGNCPAGASMSASVYSTNATTSVNLTYDLSGLAAGTLYYWNIEVVDSSVSTNTAWGSTSTFTTAAAPTLTTIAPTGLGLTTGSIPAGNGTANAVPQADVSTNGDPSTTASFCLSPDPFASGGCTTTATYYVFAAAPISTVPIYQPALSAVVTQTGSGGALNVAANGELGGLDPGTTYYYEIEATNSLGTLYYGGVVSFTTYNNISVTTTPVTSGTFNGTNDTAGFTMNGTITTYNDPATTWYYCYSATSFATGTCTGQSGQVFDPSRANSLAAGLGSTPQNVSITVTNLSPATTFYVQLIGTNSSNNRFYNGIESFTTANAPTLSVTSAPATVLSTTSATLNGSVNPNGDPNVSAINFCYSTSSSLASCSGATVAAASTTAITTGATSATTESATISSLTPGTTYYYQLEATNSLGTIYYSPVSTFTSANTLTLGTLKATSSNAAGSVTFGGTVDANGDPSVTSIEFCYAPHSSGIVAATTCTGTGATTLAATAPTYTAGGTDAVTAFATLSPGVTYDYFLLATNSLGTVYYSSLGTPFTTAAAVTIAGMRTAAPGYTGGVSATSSITLYAVVSANGDPNVTSIKFCYAPHSSGMVAAATCTGSTAADSQGSFTNGIGGEVSATLTGLSPGTVYDYYVLATNSIGTVYYSSPLSTFTSANKVSLATTAVTYGGSPGSVGLNGTLDTNGDPTVTGVQFCYSTSSSLTASSTCTGSTTPASPSSFTNAAAGSNAVTGTLSGLSTGVAYYYFLMATNSAGQTYESSVAHFTSAATLSVATGAASSPGYIAASGGTPASSSMHLAGSVAANGDPSVSSIQFCYALDSVGLTAGTSCSGSTIAATPSTFTNGTGGSVSAALAGLTPGTTYDYFLMATNSVGLIYYGTVGTLTSANELSISSVSATSNNASGSVTFTGTVTASGDPSVTSIQFCYALASVGLTAGTSCSGTVAAATPPNFVGGGQNNELDLSSLAAGTTYDYFLMATNSAGQVYYSARQTFTTAAAPTIGVSAPTNFTIDATGTATGVTLGGTVNANGDPNVHAIEFCWKSSSVATSCSGATFANASAATASGTSPTTEFALVVPTTLLAPATTYYFNLEATNSLGTVYLGSGSSFTTPAAPTVVTGTALIPSVTAATLQGTINSNGDPATTYQFCYSQYAFTSGNCAGTLGATFTPSTSISGSASLSIALTGLLAPTTYYVELMATNEAGVTYYGGVTTFTTTFIGVGSGGTGATTGTATAVTGAASGVGATSATLNAVVNANGSLNTHGIVFCYSATSFTSGNCGGTVIAGTPASVTGTSPTSVSATLTGLTAATTYYVEVQVTTSTGVVIYGGVQSFTTASNLVPQATLSLAASSATVGSSITLSTSGGSGSGAVTFTVTGGTAAGCAVTGSTLSATGPGTCLVTATKAADVTYQAASSSATSFTFNAAPAPPKPARPGVVVIHFASGSWTLTGSSSSSLVALGHHLVRGALIRIIGFGYHNSALAHRRVMAIERMILRIVKVRVQAVFVTGPNANLGKVVTLEQ